MTRRELLKLAIAFAALPAPVQLVIGASKKYLDGEILEVITKGGDYETNRETGVVTFVEAPAKGELITYRYYCRLGDGWIDLTKFGNRMPTIEEEQRKR